jgi:hypothetical protein
MAGTKKHGLRHLARKTLSVTGLVGFGAYQLGKMNKGNNNK